jgi:HlyD family secretion protein
LRRRQKLSQENLKKLEIDESQRLTRAGNGRRTWIIAGAVVLAVIILVSAKNMLKKTEVNVTKAYETSSGEPITLLNASGYVTARRKATVAAKITGRVREMLVEEGKAVKEGELLAILDEKDAEASLDRARASARVFEAQVAGTNAKYNEAKASYERGKSLFESGFLDNQSLDTLKANYLLLESEIKAQKRQIEEARAGSKVAERELINCEVRAPFDGIVISKDAQPGEMVSPFSAGGGFTRTGIVTIVDMNSLEIEVDVNESHLSKVYPDEKVTAILDAYPDFKIPAKVRAIIPSADRQKATVKVRIGFESLDPRILPDMGARVSFLKDASTGEKNVYIAKSAVKTADGKSWVLVVNKGVVEKREIVLGEEASEAFEVRKGLSEGETVVSESPEELKPGQRVKIRNRA